MGTSGRALVKLDINELVELLNKALADEWLAYYQYWTAAKIAEGPMRPAVAAEFVEHAGEELKHADMLAERIIQLGGKPITHPNEWEKIANCKYIDPTNPSVVALLKQGVDGERCAIGVYSALLEKTKDKDIVSYHMILSILEEELEHEEDFEALLQDLGQ